MICFIINLICCIGMVLGVVVLSKKVKRLVKENEDLLKHAQEEASDFIIDKVKLQERVKELENGIKDSFGISVRNEVTKIECVFDKFEMVIMMAGIYQLIEHSGNIEDKEAYIKLYKKIEDNVQKMEEEPIDD